MKASNSMMNSEAILKFLDNDYEYDITENDNIYSNGAGSKKQTGYRHFYDTSNAQSIQDCNQIISQLDGWTSTQKKYSVCLLANFKLNERRIHQLTRTMLEMQKRLRKVQYQPLVYGKSEYQDDY